MQNIFYKFFFRADRIKSIGISASDWSSTKVAHASQMHGIRHYSDIVKTCFRTVGMMC